MKTEHREIEKANSNINDCKIALEGVQEDLEHLKTYDVKTVWLTGSKEVRLYEDGNVVRNYDDGTRELLKILVKIMLEAKTKFLENKIIEFTQQLKEKTQEL